MFFVNNLHSYLLVFLTISHTESQLLSEPTLELTIVINPEYTDESSSKDDNADYYYYYMNSDSEYFLTESTTEVSHSFRVCTYGKNQSRFMINYHVKTHDITCTFYIKLITYYSLHTTKT